MQHTISVSWEKTPVEPSEGYIFGEMREPRYVGIGDSFVGRYLRKADPDTRVSLKMWISDMTNVPDSYFEYAMIRRVGAAFIDWGVLYLFLAVILEGPGAPGLDGEAQEAGLIGLLPLLVWLSNSLVAEAAFGRTLGKYCLGLRVISTTSEPLVWTQVVKRFLALAVDYSVFLLPAFISMRRTEHRQRLGDLWGRTVVVMPDRERCPPCGTTTIPNSTQIGKGRFQCRSCGNEVVLGESDPESSESLAG